MPGTLFQLEGYNGFGYRDHHPTVPSPYLWSFSNHYTRGKYVADGRFSPTAVSQQCGAAVLLKRLAGRRTASPCSRGRGCCSSPTRTSPGPDVVEAQKLLVRRIRTARSTPASADGEYGELTAGAVQRAKWELGYPANARDSTFGPQLKAFLSGKKPLPAAFKKRRAQRLKQAGSRAGDPQADRPVGALGLQEQRPDRATRRTATCGSRCSASGARAARDRLLGLRDALLLAGRARRTRTRRGTYDARQPAFTGSMLGHCRKIPKSAAQARRPGGLDAAGTGQHVCLVVAGGADPMLVSHGDDSGPKSSASRPRTPTSAATGTARRSG